MLRYGPVFTKHRSGQDDLGCRVRSVASLIFLPYTDKNKKNGGNGGLASAHWFLTRKHRAKYACWPAARIMTRYTTAHMRVFALDGRLSGSSALPPPPPPGGQWEGCLDSFATPATRNRPKKAPGRFLDSAPWKEGASSSLDASTSSSTERFLAARTPFWPESDTDPISLHVYICINSSQYSDALSTLCHAGYSATHHL